MKVAQICPRYYPHIGGVEEHVKNISERLAKKYDVSVFTTDPSGKLPKQEEISGVRVKRFKSFAPNEAYYFSPRMLRELRKVKFDIVHGHAFHAFPLFFSRYAKKKKFIVTTHYHGFGHTLVRNLLLKLYKQIGKKTLHDCNKIICVSNYERNLLLSHFEVNAKKVVVIPNGITSDEFKNLKKKEKGEYRKILCVARLEKYKGIEYVLKALQELGEDILLEIVGKGPYRTRLVKLLDRLKLENRVRFFQDLPRKRLLELYASADLFVLLSKHEAFASSVAEALASKTPCIVANSSALKEWIDNKNCFGINCPIDIDELAKLINKVIGKEVRGAKLLDWDDVVRELEKVYDS